MNFSMNTGVVWPASHLRHNSRVTQNQRNTSMIKCEQEEHNAGHDARKKLICSLCCNDDVVKWVTSVNQAESWCVRQKDYDDS